MLAHGTETRPRLALLHVGAERSVFRDHDDVRVCLDDRFGAKVRIRLVDARGHVPATCDVDEIVDVAAPPDGESRKSQQHEDAWATRLRAGRTLDGIPQSSLVGSRTLAQLTRRSDPLDIGVNLVKIPIRQVLDLNL